MKQIYDFNNIKDDDIFIGDIEVVVGINEELLNEIKEMHMEDYFVAITSVPAKSDVTLIKLSDDLYVDFDIKISEYLNYCLEHNIFNDNNYFLRTNPKSPFIGQLIITNVKKKSINKELKLRNN